MENQKSTNKNQQLKNKWLLESTAALSLTGLGLCLVADASAVKSSGAAFMTWFLYGVVGLIVFNGGIAVFGNAIKTKIHLENRIRRAHKAPYRNRTKKNRNASS